MVNGKSKSSRFTLVLLVFLAAVLLAGVFQSVFAFNLVAPTKISKTPITLNISNDVSTSVDDSGNVFVGWISYSLENSDELKISKLSSVNSVVSGETTLKTSGGGLVGVSQTIDHLGRILVTWAETSGYYDYVFFSISSDGGASFSNPVRVDSNSGHVHASPSIVVDSSNNIYIVWSDSERSGIYFAKSTDGGHKFVVKSVSSFGSGVKMAIDEGDRIYLSWFKAGGQDVNLGWFWNLYFMFSEDKGSSFSKPKVVAELYENNLPQGYQFDNAIAAGSSGEVFIAWSWKHMYLVRSFDGGDTFDTPTMVDGRPDSSYQFNPWLSVYGNSVSLVFEDSDTFLSAWRGRGIWLGRSADDGATFEPIEIVSQQGEVTNLAPNSVLDKDGRVWVAWGAYSTDGSIFYAGNIYVSNFAAGSTGNFSPTPSYSAEPSSSAIPSVTVAPPTQTSEPGVVFEKKYEYNGGTSIVYSDTAFDIVASGSGYLLVGQENQNNDIWLVCTNLDGDVLWNSTYGERLVWDDAYSLIKTNDGGYAIVGETKGGSEDQDGLLLKLDSSGNLQWSKTYGGLYDDKLLAVLQETDGGYVLAGNMRLGEYGPTNCWLIRTDSNGNTLWEKQYGGAQSEGVSRASIVKTADGGYVFGGTTESYGAGSSDFWLVKVDSSGNQLWDKTFGSAQEDYLSKLVQTKSGEFLLLGYYYVSQGQTDIRIIKVDDSGNSLWSKTYGAPGYAEQVNSGFEAADGTIVAVGRNWSLAAHYGSIFRFGNDGTFLSAQNFAGPYDSDMFSVAATSDQGFAITGYTEGKGYDFWLIKMGPLEPIPEFPLVFIWPLLIALGLVAVKLRKRSV
jgi:hypothetical protein